MSDAKRSCPPVTKGREPVSSDLLIDEMKEPKRRTRDHDVQEVQNYVAAMKHRLERLQNLPLSLRLVREIHGRLMKGVWDDRATTREFRRSQNWIGPSGSTLETASYVPPPPEYLDDLRGDWEQFLDEPNTLPDLIRCAIIHEQFEAMHPFLDGNGRLGRLLITFFLIELDRLPQPLPTYLLILKPIAETTTSFGNKSELTETEWAGFDFSLLA